MQRIAVAEATCAAEQAGGTEGGPACANLLNETASALSEWYRASVSPGLRQALGAPSFEIEAALAEWLFWQQETEVRLGGLLGPCGPMQLNCNDAHAAATAAVADMAERRLQNCTGTSLASQFRDVSRVADFADVGAIDLPGAGLPADLLHACAHLEIEVTEFPSIAALFHANTLRGRVTVDVRSGPDRTDVPLTLTVGGAAVSTAADGTFQTTVTPGEAGLPLDVELEAEANEPTLQTTSFTAKRTLTTPTRARLELQALTPTTIAAGGSVSLRVRVAGDGMAGAVVPLTVGGPGAVAPASVTTDAAGGATAVYTAPADTLVTAATITATLPDGTGVGVPITIAPFVVVGLSPVSATLSPGQSINLTATVTGTFVTSVTWTTTGGEVVSTGATTARYVGGSTPGTFSVTATSTADLTATASSTITIADLPTGVVRETSRAIASVALVNVPGPTCGFQGSPAQDDTVLDGHHELLRLRGDPGRPARSRRRSPRVTGGTDLSSVSATGSGSASGTDSRASVSASASTTVTVVLSRDERLVRRDARDRVRRSAVLPHRTGNPAHPPRYGGARASRGPATRPLPPRHHDDDRRLHGVGERKLRSHCEVQPVGAATASSSPSAFSSRRSSLISSRSFAAYSKRSSSAAVNISSSSVITSFSSSSRDSPSTSPARRGGAPGTFGVSSERNSAMSETPFWIESA